MGRQLNGKAVGTHFSPRLTGGIFKATTIIVFPRVPGMSGPQLYAQRPVPKPSKKEGPVVRSCVDRSQVLPPTFPCLFSKRASEMQLSLSLRLAPPAISSVPTTRVVVREESRSSQLALFSKN